jgi:hypothetical protein
MAEEQLKDFTEEQLTTSADDMTCAEWCQDQCQLSGHVSLACIGSQPDIFAESEDSLGTSLIGQVLGVADTVVCKDLCLGLEPYEKASPSTSAAGAPSTSAAGAAVHAAAHSMLAAGLAELLLLAGML